MSLNYKIIGKRIKEIRSKQKLTQLELADIIEKSYSYISYIETGKKQLSLETLIDIANALRVTADELLSSNILYPHKVKDEFSTILEDCSTFQAFYKLLPQARQTILYNIIFYVHKYMNNPVVTYLTYRIINYMATIFSQKLIHFYET